MRPLELGLPLPTIDLPMSAGMDHWKDYRRVAHWAEEVGFDTVWLPDELLWKFPPDFTPMGTWECVAMTGAVAASTSRIKVGTWVLSALHRNPGLTARVAETLDDISEGRFIFGLGAGHAGAQGKAFGYPSDRVVGRYEEALEIIIPLIRDGQVTFEGEHHSAFEQDNTPRGPRGPGLPIVLAGHGPRTIALAVKYGDIWSAFATESSLPEAFSDMVELVSRTCEEQDRDPKSLGRSIGVFVELTDARFAEEIGLGVPLRGSPAQVAEQVYGFADMGVTMLELIPGPFNGESMEKLAELVEILDG